jgi:hypothetical protein
MEKAAPSERFRRELDEVLGGVGGEQDPIETVGRLGVRLILQQAPEDQVTELPGRGRHDRASETVAHRSGHEPRTLRTTSRTMRLERPRIRDAGRLGFESRILNNGRRPHPCAGVAADQTSQRPPVVRLSRGRRREAPPPPMVVLAVSS